MTNKEIYGWLETARYHLLNNRCQEAAKVIIDITRELKAREQPPAETIRVRVAVAVQSDGQVSSCGIYGQISDARARGTAEESIDYEEMVASAIVEADIPKLPTIPGHVLEANHERDR